MKPPFFLFFCVVFLFACTPTQSTQLSTSDQKSTAAPNFGELIIGKWTLKSYVYDRTIYENDQFPAYNNGDVVWEFTADNQLLISKKNPGEPNEDSPKVGTYRYGFNEIILSIDGVLYLANFNNEFMGNVMPLDGKVPEKIPFGGELWLDSNLDPLVSGHEPELYLVKIQ